MNRGTTGIALLVDTDRGYKLRHVFDMSDTNSREGRTIPIWQMKPQYEGAVVEALANSYGEFSDKSNFAECLMQTAKVIVGDNFSDYCAELRGVKEGSLLEELDDLRTCTNRLKSFQQSTKSSSSNGTNCLSRTGRYFIIFRKAAGVVEPRQRTLNDPPLGQDLPFRLDTR